MSSPIGRPTAAGQTGQGIVMAPAVMLLPVKQTTDSGKAIRLYWRDSMKTKVMQAGSNAGAHTYLQAGRQA